MGELMTMTKQEYEKTTARIRENLAGIVDKFVYVGWLLNNVVKTEGYKLGGYKTVAEYAKAELGNMSADTVSRFINVFKTYGNGDTPELQEKYKEYKYTMLVEMLQLTNEDRAMISPNTPRETIRALNRFNAEQTGGVDTLMGWQQDSADLLRAAVADMIKVYDDKKLREILQENNTKELVEYICPSGNKSFKKGLVFMIMTEESINVKIFGRENNKITWEQITALIAEAMPPEEIAPAQTEEPEVQQAPEEVEKIPTEDITVEDSEEQIPGQDNILYHEEFMPKPEKTAEQKYNEQQARIDAKTKKALEQQEDDEKMQNLPSDSTRKPQTIRIGFSFYEEMQHGRNFDLRKTGDFKAGDILEYMLFDQEKYTGKSLKRTITFVLTDKDATGLEKDYCIIGLE